MKSKIGLFLDRVESLKNIKLKCMLFEAIFISVFYINFESIFVLVYKTNTFCLFPEEQ